MTVLITRPSPFGEHLVARLRQIGIHALHTPLIEFCSGRQLDQLPQWLEELSAGDMIFAASQPAVHYAVQGLKQQGGYWPTYTTYFAIGRSTANVLQQAAQQSVYYPKDREISEHLLQLPELQSIAGKTMLILRGNSGRDYLAQQLRLRGVCVKFCECYQRVSIAYNSTELMYKWQEVGINKIVITSAELLQRLFALVPPPSQAWLLNCHLVVVSERIATLAHQLGWRHIQLADNADNDSLLKALVTQI